MKHLKTLITLFLLVIGTSVLWAQDEETVPMRTAVWNWKQGVPTTISAETNFENTKGYVHSEDDPASLKLEVDATKGSFTYVKSGKVNYASLTSGCTIKAPVRRSGDKVAVICQNEDYENYSIGTGGTVTVSYDGWTKIKTYSATAADAAQGYVLIEAINEVHFFQIEVVQDKFSSVLPMIQLNSKGWASFTSLIEGYVVKLPSSATAYVATAVHPDDGEYGKVILTKVEKFGCGEGVFINGADFDGVYANVVKGGTSDVPKIANNLTVGCKKDVVLTYESCAYVIATKGANEDAGFYYVNSNVTVPAGKAYLYDSQAQAKERRAKVLKITFADGSEATGIESLFAGAEAETPTVFYNLSGQKVGKNYKGVVIGNDGKKYVK